MSISSSSWGLGRAAVCDCDTPWTFLLPFLHVQHCSLRGCIRPLAPAKAVFEFQNNQHGLSDPKRNTIYSNLHYDDIRGDFLRPPQHQLQKSKIKVKRDCLWKQRTHKNHEKRRLGLIECLHMQHCSLRGCISPLAPAKAVLDFQNNQDWLNGPKANIIKVKRDCLWKQRTNKITKIGGSV